MPDGKPRRIGVIINGRSGSKDVDIAAIVDRMTQEGAEILSVETPDDPSKITQLARHAAERCDTIVIGGGDGTISNTLPVFVETNRTLAVLPLGTANDLARSLDIPLDPLSAVDVLHTGTPQRIDLGEVNGRLFCNAVSVGFAAKVAGSHIPVRKKWLGTLEYPLAWIKAAREFRPFSVTLKHEVGERRFDSVFMLTVMNGRYHGRGMAVDEQAQIDDGVLKVYCIRYANGWKLPLIFLSLQQGKLVRNRETTLFRAREVQISGKRPMPLDVDGDVVGETPARIRVLPAAITVLVPGPGKAGAANSEG